MTSKIFRFSTAAMVLASAVLAQVETQAPTELEPVNPDDYYNPGEERLSFDMIMKPYPIPIRTTTYTDFFFNIPDDTPDLFHVVLTEVINSQPLHLHHFVLIGCSEKIEEDQQGISKILDSDHDSSCTTPLGGWAPGNDNMLGNTDLNAGVLMGRGMGVQAIILNVHYTDGVYEDEATKTYKMATDGIRFHYTPEFRPYTTVTTPLIDVGYGPKSLTIPPGEERFFLTRTCRVNTRCKDLAPDLLRRMAGYLGVDEAVGGVDLSKISCPMIKPFCSMGGEIGPWIQRLCPESCGFCDKTDSDGNPINNPLNPDAYRITAINYHAHLLGTEMYATLLQEEEDETTGTTAIQRDGTSNIVVKDIESRDFWLYDYQSTIPLQYDSFKDDKLMRGTEVKVGDKMQATCVYNSSYRTEATLFSLTTYDEMCIITVSITFDTPLSLLKSNEDGCCNDKEVATLGLELQLMQFTCDLDEESDVYSGTLTADEDGRNIWKDHPIESTTGCTYPVTLFSRGLRNSRNCDSDGGAYFGDVFDYPTGDGARVCVNMGDDFEFLSNEGAGATCNGGTSDNEDLNTGVTETQCKEGGGEWEPYTCGEIDYWIISEASADFVTPDDLEYLIENWWEPKCCKKSEELQSEEHNGNGDGADSKPIDEMEGNSKDELKESNVFASGACDSIKNMPLTMAAFVAAAAMAL